jgi:hypothetical protein
VGEFAQSEFALNERMPDGSTKREQLIALLERGIDPPELTLAPACPSSCVYLWEWWGELNERRRPGFNGFEPIPHSELRAFEELRRIQLTPFEQQTLIVIDRMFLAFIQDQREKSAKSEGDD